MPGAASTQPGSTLGARHAWPLIRAYWVSDQRWRAWGLVAALIALDLVIVYRAAEVSFWQKGFYDTLSAREIARFWPLLAELALLGLAAVILETVRTHAAQTLEMRWRSWMTGAALERWLDNSALYRAQHEPVLDNPDQRIAEDLKLLASMLPSLALGLLSNLVSLITFTTIVWNLSGIATLSLWGYTLEVPGYMLWAAILYALAGSIFMEKFAGQLVRVDYDQQKAEAGFRHRLIRLRESAEQVALHGGGVTERAVASGAFQSVRDNWRHLMHYTKRVTATDRLYLEGGALAAYSLAGPRYFSGQMSLGDLMQLSQSFMKVRASLSWFIYRFKDIALLRSACIRLAEFHVVMQPAEHTRIRWHSTQGALDIHDLCVRAPDGRPLLQGLQWRVAPGERWLLQGRSGIGKSTLLRSIAGLWAHSEGSIARPPGEYTLFLPQRSYMPQGSLKLCMSYPQLPDCFATDDYHHILDAIGLSDLQNELDLDTDWSKRLSPGQQQQLALGRVLLHKPRMLFVDEASSALDARTEAKLYTLLLQELPQLTLISIGHRPSLREFHTHVLDLDVLQKAETARATVATSVVR
nr:ABC transporter ATP-binding protein/permease [uncultured Rhodoferax sp.]